MSRLAILGIAISNSFLSSRFVRDREQDERRRLRPVPVRFDRRHLRGLMLGGVEAVLIADEGLQRGEDRDHAESHAHHRLGLGPEPARQKIAGADGEHDKRGREIGRREHVREAVGEARIENDGEPVDGIGDAVADLVPGRGLHPAVGGEDPERRERRADRDQHRGKHVDVRRDALPAEQHDAEERGFEEECRQNLVAEQGSEHISDDDREAAPVGAELVGQHDPRHHAHGEAHGEDLGPEARQAMEMVLARDSPAYEEGRDERRETDREAREDDVEGDRERELDAREQCGVEIHVAPALLTGPYPRQTYTCVTDRGFPIV